MINIDLKKELQKIAKENENQEDFLASVSKQLEYESAEDRAILRSMGMDNSIRIAEEKKNSIIELKRNVNKFQGDVFTIHQIKDLAIKYRLRFLNSGCYKGHIENTLPIIIKNFLKENNIEKNEAILQYCFYILAPMSSFRLQKKPKPIAPLIFYKIDDIHYRLVHKWGKDLNVKNRIIGAIMRNPLTFILFFWLFLGSIHLGFVFSGLLSPYSILLMIFYFLITLAVGANMDNADKFSERSWNLEHK